MTHTAPTTAEPRFEIGQTYTTPGALETTSLNYMLQCLARHVRGDWGCVCAEDRETNNEALSCGLRIFSAYPIDPAKPCEGWGKNTLWIVTEADRSVTTFLLPEEY